MDADMNPPGHPDAGVPGAGMRSAAQLRQEFDAAFARPLQAGTQPMEDHLAIRLAGDPHALCLAEIAVLAALGALTQVPGPRPELLGLIGLRGALVPVYDLRMLLGYTAVQAPRWVVVAAAAPVALAFDGFDGHLRLPRAARTQPDDPRLPRRHVPEVLHTAPQARPLVAVAAVLETIRAAAARPVS
jgi:chemotaxis signal transduction protein